MNEENKNSASGEMTGVRDAGAIARDIKKLLSAKLQKMSSGSRSGRRSAWSDFCNFRIMLFPQIIKILWFLGMIVSTLGGLFLIIGGISRGAWGSAGLGLLVLLFSPIVTHLLLEFTMVPFSIMEILREIRDDVLDCHRNRRRCLAAQGSGILQITVDDIVQLVPGKRVRIDGLQFPGRGDPDFQL